LPLTVSSTRHYRQKREDSFRLSAKNTQNHPKTRNDEDKAKFHSAFSATALGYVTHLGEYEE
jgi:hypothetical protein